MRKSTVGNHNINFHNRTIRKKKIKDFKQYIFLQIFQTRNWTQLERLGGSPMAANLVNMPCAVRCRVCSAGTPKTLLVIPHREPPDSHLKQCLWRSFIIRWGADGEQVRGEQKKRTYFLICLQSVVQTYFGRALFLGNPTSICSKSPWVCWCKLPSYPKLRGFLINTGLYFKGCVWLESLISGPTLS